MGRAWVAGAVAYLAPLVLNQEPKLKRQVCCALAQIAKHSVDMAEVVVEAEVFPKILTCLKFPDELVRKHAATVVREVSPALLLRVLSPVPNAAINPEFHTGLDTLLNLCPPLSSTLCSTLFSMLNQHYI